MGINTGFARLLVRARTQGVRFDSLVTIGRQSLAVPKRELSALARHAGLGERAETVAGEFADEFLKRFLGANTISAIDYSDYQQADIIHDLNQPIPAGLEGRFDALVDGGSLEHIFDVRQALTNYMKLVRSGGSVFILTTANNLCGHGFYQFSPEFFFRVFDTANGFRTEDVVLMESPLLSVEKSRNVRYYSVKDPARVGKRIQLVNNRPTMIFIHATRTGEQAPFAAPPLQSDYDNLKWQSKRLADDEAATAAGGNPVDFDYLSPLEEARRKFRQKHKNSRRNKRFFQPVRF